MFSAHTVEKVISPSQTNNNLLNAQLFEFIFAFLFYKNKISDNSFMFQIISQEFDILNIL